MFALALLLNLKYIALSTIFAIFFHHFILLHAFFYFAFCFLLLIYLIVLFLFIVCEALSDCLVN